MITAAQASDIANNYHDKNIENEFFKLSIDIKFQADRGFREWQTDTCHNDNVNYLRKLGYKVVKKLVYITQGNMSMEKMVWSITW